MRASGVGWYNTTVGLSGLVASLVDGSLWDQVGHAAVFLFGAGFAVVGGIALLVLVPGDARRDAHRLGDELHQREAASSTET
jgi:hypothetical protein